MSSSRTNPTAVEFMKANLIRGASCQGGHSTEGQKIAGLLGVPFPLRMENLAKKAVKLGLDPADLWPWYTKGGDA